MVPFLSAVLCVPVPGLVLRAVLIGLLVGILILILGVVLLVIHVLFLRFTFAGCRYSSLPWFSGFILWTEDHCSKQPGKDCHGDACCTGLHTSGKDPQEPLLGYGFLHAFC